ncbi:scp-like extracellular [Botrytis cinerea]
MRSSIALASVCAAFAAASPLVKKGLEIGAAVQVVETQVDIVTNVVMVTVTGEAVTVTAGAEPTPAPVIGSCTTFAHDLTAGGGGYGQNIAVSGNSDSGAFTTEAALADHIKQWYEEESLFGSLYGVASPSEAVGDFLHFTQIVWQGSHQVGCAVKTCGTDNSIYPGMYIWYSVCNYYPAGNVIGEFATNVLS